MNQHGQASRTGGSHAGHPNYMAIFWWLLALTIAEVGVGIMSTGAGAAHIAKIGALVVLALVKAALVAMYFMHLRFEKRTLALIAGTPLVLCVLLMLLLLPDSSASHAPAPAAAAPAGTPAPH